MQELKTKEIRIKLSVYSRIGNGDILLSSSVNSIKVEDISVDSIKKACKSKLEIDDSRFQKDVLYYMGNKVIGSFRARNLPFESFEYEAYLSPDIDLV